MLFDDECLSQRPCMPYLKHVWFGMLPTLLRWLILSMGNTYELQNRLGVLFSFTLKLDLNEMEHAPSIYPLKLHINERIYMLSGGGG